VTFSEVKSAVKFERYGVILERQTVDIAGRGLTYFIIPTGCSWIEKGKLKRRCSASIGFKVCCIPNANGVTTELDFIEKISNNIVPRFLKLD
jgi:hypothetical protein